MSPPRKRMRGTRCQGDREWGEARARASSGWRAGDGVGVGGPTILAPSPPPHIRIQKRSSGSGLGLGLGLALAPTRRCVWW
jgi:hypothetical protein